MARHPKALTNTALAATLTLLMAGCGLLTSQKTPSPVSRHSSAPRASSLAQSRSRTPSGPLPWRSHQKPSYLPGDVLIADSYNNRILIVTPGKRVVWQFPRPGVSPNRRFKRPDDAFFGPHFDEIITNEEDFQTVAIINFLHKRVVWEYGHHGVPGSLPGYLNTPDDAFLYAKNGGLITVADIRNQRILFISRKTHQIVKQYGQTDVQVVNPPTTWGAPNGDFPAPHGGMLVTQINGNDAVLLNKQGQIVWTVHFPSQFSYPSDANFTPHGNIMVAFYTNPGALIKMSPSGRILWEYAPTSGPGRLNKPSLATELPNGMVLLNDDYNDRVIVINPHTNQIVWQYGHTGVPGSAPGYLNIPDGLDFLPAGITPGARNPIGHHLWSYPGNGY